jgi:chromate transporter
VIAVGPEATRLLRIWTRIGLQSFGGGQAVQLYAYEELVDRRGWLRPEDWAEAWGICQMVPGVNVIAVAALTGHRLAAWPGVAASVGGLIVPSVLITVLMAAGFVQVRDLHWVKTGLHGLVFAAAGGSVMVGYRLIRPLLRISHRESAMTLAASIGVVVVAALLALSGRVPLLAVLLAAGAVLAAVVTLSRRPIEPAEVAR